jgi:AcrR family transcriptional regulator
MGKSMIKDVVKKNIVEEATKIFFESSIPSVTISAISKQVGVGEATMYRYFKTKQNLVLACAEYAANKIYNQYMSFSCVLNGFDGVEKFYRCFLKIFQEHRNYFSFIDQFDSYLINEDMTNERDIYESAIEQYKKVFDNFYSLGLEDGSINHKNDRDLFYYATTHALLSLCKKLAGEKVVIAKDKTMDCEREIEIIIEIILSALK